MNNNVLLLRDVALRLRGEGGINMIYALPFDVIFAAPDGTETVIEGWTQAESMGYAYFEASMGELKFSVQTFKQDQWYLKIANSGTAPVTGFAGIRFPWKHREEGFTLIPGIYYDGNYHEYQKDIPVIHLPEKPCFAASVSAATFPAVLVKEEEIGWHYAFSPTSLAGWNGIALDAARENLTIYTPAREENYYLHTRFSPFDRPAYTWEPRAVVCVRFSRTEFDCKTVTDLMDYHWETAIRSDRYPAHNTPKLPEGAAAELVRDWVYGKHCVITDKGEPMILNAFTDLEKDWPHAGWAEWNIMIGWCCGTMTALPLLKYGGKYRNFAVKFIDFLAAHGDSPSGVKYSVYDGNAWMDRNHPEFHSGYNHCRFYSDYLYYLGKAIRFEKETNGTDHPAWEAEFKKGLDILTDLWEREKDFGMYWDVEGEHVTLDRSGTCAGAFALLALAEGCRQYPENTRLCEYFRQACRSYHERFVLTGRSFAGPIDIWEADDSESIAALSDALVQQYQLFGGEENRKQALDAAKLFATWCVNYQPAFPGGSTLEGINVCGGVLANVQNRHIGPGICTNSARFVYDLGEITGDKRWTELYFRIKAAAINCVCTYDGEFCGETFDQIFAKGMLSEQINMTNSLNAAGETWRVSASWPATAVLLGWFDTP